MQMGFTVGTYPSIPSKVQARAGHIPVSGNNKEEKEAEDAAVADVVEELLAMPQASGSGGGGLKRSQTTTGAESIPGAWVMK